MKFSRSLIFISLLTSLCIASCSSSPYVDDDGFTYISIDNSDFSAVYPAVWFAPDTQAIEVVNLSRRPPSEGGFQIMIEPQDPEISVVRTREAVERNRHFSAVTLSAKDADEKTKEQETKKRLLRQIRGKHLRQLPAHFIYNDGGIEYELVVLSFDKKEQELEFKWRRGGARRASHD